VTRDLYFLASHSPPDASKLAYAPCRIKATKYPASDPLLAFAAKSLGEQLMVGRGIGSECAIVAFSALDTEVATQARKQPILFFDSPEAVVRYLEQGPDFAFEAHITSFEVAYAYAQRAL
jgi:hypothetical protein